MLRSRPLVSALLGVLLAGCAGHGPPRLAERDRARLGTIAVIAAEVPPEWSFTYPVPSGPGAAFAGIGAGLGTGVLSGALCMVSFGRVVEACGLAIWTPVMMVSGGIEGGRKGVPLAEFVAAAGALALVAGESQVQEALRDQIVRLLLAREESRSGAAWAGRGPIGPEERRDYRALAAEGVDTVVEVYVLDVRLARPLRAGSKPAYGVSPSFEDIINPTLELRARARLRVIRTSDGAEILTHTFGRAEPGDDFAGWGRAGAERFRTARSVAADGLARAITEALLGEAAPPSSPPPAPLPEETALDTRTPP
jgi:hypothetical protein